MSMMTKSLLSPPAARSLRRRSSIFCESHFSRSVSFVIRSSLPFSSKKARFYKEAVEAVDVVERACRLCVDVKRTLVSNDDRIIEKNDQTPVTIADFSVQALISLELKRSFPSIPLVAEEDSLILRSGSSQKDNILIDSVVSAVSDKVTSRDEPLTYDDIFKAIDRGGKDAVSFDERPTTYWVLDPIDGTRGFLKESDVLYVVGLALVVEGEVVLGIMGCPNWKSNTNSAELGVLMVSHEGCGTWTRQFLKYVYGASKVEDNWQRCFVDSYRHLYDARFCIPDSQTWDSLPLASLVSSSFDTDGVKDTRLISLCCGSLCKYMTIASGRASVFIQQAKVQTAIKVWDHAVGIICVKEAGGQVTDWRGDELDLAADQKERRILFPFGGVLISNGNLHDRLLEIISSNSSMA